MLTTLLAGDMQVTAGHRSGPIFIRNSMHTPVSCEAILDSLEALWDLPKAEPESSVRAVLGHHLFVFIHPYFDGNGRIGRFLMNALEAASAEGQITPLAKFIAQEMAVWSPEHGNPEVKAWENNFKKYSKKTISA